MTPAVWLAAAALALLALRAGCAWHALRRQSPGPPPADPDGMAGVAVLQPILGGDPRLAATLGDVLDQLPHARFHWLVDADDPVAQAAVADALRTHPQARVRVHACPPPPDGINPKSFKLDLALPAVAAPVCLVLDDDTRLSASALAVLLSALDGAALATALPGYRDDGEGLPGRLLAQFVNDNAALTYLAPLAFAPPLSINGMCYALRSDDLRRMGGFAPLLPALADDLAMAGLVRAHGGRIAQTPAPVEVATSLSGAGHYVRQMHRWMLFATLLLARQPPGARLRVVLFNGLPPLLLWACLAALAWRPSPAGAAAVALLLVARAAVSCGFQRRLTGRVRHRPGLSLLAELLQPLHLLHAACVRTVRWRSRRYRVHADGGFDAA